MASAAQDFVFWPKKEPEEINKQTKKKRSVNALKAIFLTPKLPAWVAYFVRSLSPRHCWEPEALSP